MRCGLNLPRSGAAMANPAALLPVCHCDTGHVIHTDDTALKIFDPYFNIIYLDHNNGLLIQPQKALTLHVTRKERVSEAIFAALVIERLQAVNKDRIAMEQKVRNDAREEGKLTYDQIMVS